MNEALLNRVDPLRVHNYRALPSSIWDISGQLNVFLPKLGFFSYTTHTVENRNFELKCSTLSSGHSFELNSVMNYNSQLWMTTKDGKSWKSNNFGITTTDALQARLKVLMSNIFRNEFDIQNFSKVLYCIVIWDALFKKISSKRLSVICQKVKNSIFTVHHPLCVFFCSAEKTTTQRIVATTQRMVDSIRYNYIFLYLRLLREMSRNC